MKFNTRDIKLTNDELASIYNYLRGDISQLQLAKDLKRTRTNTYYYIGRAMDYWLQIGVLKFNNVTLQEELGGKEPEEQIHG